MLWFEAFQTCAVAHKNSAIMHAQHMDIILIFARTRDVGLCRPCLHEKKTDMEQFKDKGWSFYGHILALRRNGSAVLKKIKKN